MPRIAGVDVPAEKVTWVALTAIHGIGKTSALAICKEAQIDPNGRMRDLSEDDIGHIATILDRSYVIEGALRRQMLQNIARLRDIGSYRGLRHRRGLPVRGQRTRTNARTRKGPRKTVAGKKGVKELH
ncbi:MAG: 30S ribosomal protein S13 [Planctomycetes bacterium SM23_25]|nr:MAG: 30S ribosomal protein S13 [Planctomycetes bacterium DG_20]KPK48665.1 MAG: 30S ribosomal protein S13 [Planctomycetes bacterium SM23_25]